MARANAHFLDQSLGGFPGGSELKDLPAVPEAQVWSLGQEDLLYKGMATHSSIFALENSMGRGA